MLKRLNICTAVIPACEGVAKAQSRAGGNPQTPCCAWILACAGTPMGSQRFILSGTYLPETNRFHNMFLVDFFLSINIRNRSGYSQ